MYALYYGRVATTKQLKRGDTMKKITQTATLFNLENGYFVEVIKEGETVEFYLFNKEYGIKRLMFGFHEDTAPPKKWAEIIEANADSEIEFFKTLFED